MAEASGLRVSDEQRERAAAEIRERFAAGRLDADELSERLEATYRARNENEVQALRADLPVLPVSAAQRQTELATRRARLRRELVQQTGGALVPFVICTVIWAASGGLGVFWPAWVALAALIPLVRNGWRLYGPAPELDRVEAELAHRRAREQRRNHRRISR